MGELIKKIGILCVHDRSYSVELNKSSGLGGDLEIHIQSDDARFELSQSEYIELIASVVYSEAYLRALKDIK